MGDFYFLIKTNVGFKFDRFLICVREEGVVDVSFSLLIFVSSIFFEKAGVSIIPKNLFGVSI